MGRQGYGGNLGLACIWVFGWVCSPFPVPGSNRKFRPQFPKWERFRIKLSRLREPKTGEWGDSGKNAFFRPLQPTTFIRHFENRMRCGSPFLLGRSGGY